MDKQIIRSYIAKRKSKMTLNEIKEKSDKIIETLMQSSVYLNSENLFVYVNYNQEVITTDFIQLSLNQGKRVFVPKIFKEENQDKCMKFIEIHSLDELTSGYYGILEPTEGMSSATEIREGLLVMPGLAFDRKLHRIGYGGGFYDRYLSLPHKFTTVAVCFEFQILDAIPYEVHDFTPNMIITNQEILVNME